MKIKIFKGLSYLLYLLAFLLPWQSRLILRPAFLNFSYFEYGTFSLYLLDIILLFFFAFFVFVSLSESKKFLVFSWAKKETKPWALYALLLFEALALISVFFALSPLLAFYRYLALLFSLVLFFLLTIKKDFYEPLKLAYAFLAGAVLQAFLAIYQFVSQKTFACKYLGLSAHDPIMPGVPVIELYQDGLLFRWLRAYGSLDHPNMLGGFLALALVLLVYLLFKAKVIPGLEKKKSLALIINYSALGLILLALILTFSRGAWLAALLGFVIVFITNYRKELRHRICLKSFECRLVLIVFFSLFFASIMLANLFTARFTFSNRLEKISYNERLFGLEQAGEIIKEKLWNGVGLGSYTLALFQKDPTYPAYVYQPVHNTFLLVFAELGVFGFLSFLAFFLALIVFSLRKKNYLLLALTGAFFIILLFDHWPLSLHFGPMLMFLILALGYNFKE